MATMTDDLARLARLTDSIEPPRDFTDRVMARLDPAVHSLRGVGVVAFGVFAAVVALAVASLVEAQQRVDAQVICAFDLVELE